jgi:hypothetical protein
VKYINVKERVWLPCYFVILIVASFSDLALWNDGANFLYYLINTGKFFVDTMWGRQSDALFEIPTLISLHFLGPSPFTIWIFKATLLLLPSSLLALQILSYQRSEETKAARFLTSVMLWILPFSLLFAVGTINLSLVASATAFGILLKKKQSPVDLGIFLLAHIILFFGHDFVLFHFLFLILWSLFSLKARWKFLIFEILWCLLFIAYRAPYWEKNQIYADYISQIPTYFNFFHFPIYCLVGYLARFTTIHWRGVTWFLGIYISASIYILYPNDFFFTVLTIRYFAIPFVILLFLIETRSSSWNLGKTELTLAFLLMTLIYIKPMIYWNNFNQKLDLLTEQEGCVSTTAAEFGNWNPPEWTVPFLSILSQNTYTPQSVVVVDSRNKECVRMGSELIIGQSFQYQTVSFYQKIRPRLDFEKIKLFTSPLPLKREVPFIMLAGWASIQFKLSPGTNKGCIKILMKAINSESIPEVIFSADKQLLEKMHLVGEVQKIIQVKDARFLNVAVMTIAPEALVWIKEAEEISCPDELK